VTRDKRQIFEWDRLPEIPPLTLFLLPPFPDFPSVGRIVESQNRFITDTLQQISPFEIPGFRPQSQNVNPEPFNPAPFNPAVQQQQQQQNIPQQQNSNSQNLQPENLFSPADQQQQQATTQSPTVLNCINQCGLTSTHEYNPVCGSDNQAYTNRGYLECSRRCGSNVQYVRDGRCQPQIAPA
jgi:hypothetical protein